MRLVAGVRAVSAYQLRRAGDGYELAEPVPGHREHRIALITPKIDRPGLPPSGWRFRPVTMMNGPVSKIWPTVADALVGFRITTPAKARKAVAAADAGEPPLPL